MKILVMSDSHGCTSAMRAAVHATSPELVLHLGDHERDCAAIRKAFPDLALRTVRGNCDLGSFELETDEFIVGGKRLFMSHGHLYGVKLGLDSIINSANARGADILLFGHTHIPYYAVTGGLAIVNPGSIGKPGILSSKKTYAVINIENGAVGCVFGDI